MPTEPLSRTLRPCPALLLLAVSCSSAPNPLQFPKGFLFGTAIAGFQVDMGCPTEAAAQCDDPHSDWYAWVTTPALIADPSLHLNGDAPSTGPGFHELYAQDLDRARDELKSNALRLSIEWSRIFPESTVGIEGQAALRARASPAALAWYHAVFAAMRARGLSPLVTINHYTLPDWIHDAAGCHADIVHCSPRGWLDPATTVHEIAKYAGFVAGEFGAEVDLWATLNEPLTAVVLAGFLQPGEARSNPPGVMMRWPEAKVAIRSMIEAHNRMADAVRANDTVDADGDGKAARVGIVLSVQATSPHDPARADDVLAAKNLSYLMNQVFLDGALDGDLDPKLDGVKEHHDELAGRTDFLGVNYYNRVTCDGLAKSVFPDDAPLFTFNPFTLRIEYDASGLTEVLAFVQRYRLPVIITETGVGDEADKGVAAKWIGETFTRARRAMDAGTRLEGYFFWTLMDNYEWNHGMSMKFGLYAVDKADPLKLRSRRVRAADAFARVASTGLIPDDLALPQARTGPARN